MKPAFKPLSNLHKHDKLNFIFFILDSYAKGTEIQVLIHFSVKENRTTMNCFCWHQKLESA
jgi:hypothetical protein